MNNPITEGELQLVRERNVLAAISSVIPGLGHIYKGHYTAGILVLLLGAPLAVWVGLLLGLATAGAGLLFPILCWVMVAIDAYYEDDRRKRRPMGVF